MTIHMTARFQVQANALNECKATIREFVDYVKASEPQTLLYVSLQEKEDPTRFTHYFIFEDEAAREVHSNSNAVNKFTEALYPNLVQPVEFTEYNSFATSETGAEI